MIRWVALAVFAITVYFVAIAPQERRLRATQLRAEELYRLANRNEAALRDAGVLRDARWRVARDLTALKAHAGEAATTVALLELLRQQAARFHVSVKSLSGSSRLEDDGAAERLDLVLHGTYENVVRTIACLSTGSVLLDVKDVSLTQASDDFGLPGVDAAVDLILYHNPTAALAQKENQRASVVR